MVKIAISERIVSAVWRDQPWAPHGVRDVRAEHLEVLSPGKQNGGPGPDFKNAVIRFAGGRVERGDVEIHVRSTDWDRHKHHKDPAYNNVILHVTYLCDLKSEHRKTESRKRLAELELGIGYAYYIERERLKQVEFAPVGIVNSYNAPCNHQLDRLGPLLARGLVDHMAERRLEAKMAKLDIANRFDIDEALFTGLARALGYSKFKESFTTIGQTAPLSLVSPLLSTIDPARRVGAAQAIYLGLAGFLGPFEGSRKDDGSNEYFLSLNAMWGEQKKKLGLDAIYDGKSWKCGGVRPANHPARRLAALGYLAAVFIDTGLLRPLETLLDEFPPNGKGVGRWLAMLIDHFNPFPDLFWSHRYTPSGKTLKSPVRMIGSGRLEAYILNSVIPSLALFNLRNGQYEQYAKILKIFHRLPGKGGSGAERMVCESALNGIALGGAVTGAAASQGRLQIYEEFCSVLAPDCEGCPLDRYLSMLPAA